MSNYWLVGSSILIMVMYFVSEIIETKDIIFPVLAALALGVWVIGNPQWTKNILMIWLSPTIASIIGISVSIFYSSKPFLAVLILIVLAALQLTLLRSEVAPSIAIMMLPVFLQIESWHYILSVSFFSGVIAVIQMMRKRLALEKKSTWNEPEGLNSRYYKEKSIQWFYVFLGVAVLVCISYFTKSMLICVPPLIVTFFEFMRAKSPLRNAPILLIVLIGLSALSGVLCLTFFHHYLHLPIWLVAGLLVFWIATLFKFHKISFAPAAAISLLPTVIPTSDLWIYPIQVIVGAVLFILIGKFFIFVDQKIRKTENIKQQIFNS